MEGTSLRDQVRRPPEIAEYVHNAMAKANYQILEDGTYYANVFLCPGVWAIGDTIEECREALRDVLSEWLTSAYEDQDILLETSELAWLSLYARRAGD
jgi:predicted RNase H-like HicB family nuclease